MAEITYLRQDQASIHVEVAGLTLPAVKSWASLEGGDLESEDTKTRPGGMLGQVNLGGPTTRTDCTVHRPYTRALHPFLVRLEDVAGQALVTVSFTILDGTGTTFSRGAVVSYKGILKTVTHPNWDSNQTGVAMLGLVIGMNATSHVS